MLNILLIGGLLVFLLVVAGMAYQLLGSARDALRFPPPGELIQVGGLRLHLYREGTGSPTVVFDSALGASSLSWVLVQSAVSEFTATCSYDRAGCGWSDPGPFPRTVEQIAEELHTLLAEAGVEKPLLLVGHSYGAFTARYFAARYPDEVSGMVLLDGADPQQWIEMEDLDRQKIREGSRLARRGAWVARLGLARLVVLLAGSGAQGVARRAASVLGDGMPRPIQDRLLSPLDRLPPRVREMLSWFWTQPKFYLALASQIESVPQSAELVNSCGAFGDLPLSVVSAPNPDPRWDERQRAAAALSSNGRHIEASRSGHWIPLDRPDLVVETIRQMVEEIRRGLAFKENRKQIKVNKNSTATVRERRGS